MDDIFEFYEMRIKCHVESMNYFASLLGYHFPEHDSDKVREPIRTGYAYIFYRTYHKNFRVTPEHEALCKDAWHEHHNHATHHIQYYKSAKDIPDIHLYEMISDWASAKFEQMNIIRESESVPLREWFNNKMANLEWTEHQLDIIKKSFDIICKNTDVETITKIWQPVLEKSDL